MISKHVHDDYYIAFMHTGWPSTVNDTGDSSKVSAAPAETTHASMKMNKWITASYENEFIKMNKINE